MGTRAVEIPLTLSMTASRLPNARLSSLHTTTRVAVLRDDGTVLALRTTARRPIDGGREHPRMQRRGYERATDPRASVPGAGDGVGRGAGLHDRAALRPERGAQRGVGRISRADREPRGDSPQRVRAERSRPGGRVAGTQSRPPHRRVAGEGDGNGPRGG